MPRNCEDSSSELGLCEHHAQRVYVEHQAQRVYVERQAQIVCVERHAQAVQRETAGLFEGATAGSKPRLERQLTPYHVGWQSLHAMQRLSKNFVGQRREARERQEPSFGSPLSYASESSTGQRIEGGQRVPEPYLWEPYYGTGEVPQETTEGELSVQEWTKGGPLLLATRTLIGNWTRIGHGIELESRIWRGQKSPDLRGYVGLESPSPTS